MSDDPNSAGGAGEDDRVLVAEHVLGLLSADEHQRVSERLRNEPALRAEKRLWRLRLQSLDREFAETPAPASVYSRLEARLFGAKKAGFWDSLALWRSIAAGGVAVAAIAIGLNVMTPRPDPEAFAAQLVAAIAAQGDSNVSFVALYDANAGKVRLMSMSGAAVPDKDFELWAIQGGETLSMGVIPVDHKVDVALPPTVAPGFGAGTVLAVTLEQKGGSPTGVAQGPIVAVGTATAI